MSFCVPHDDEAKEKDTRLTVRSVPSSMAGKEGCVNQTSRSSGGKSTARSCPPFNNVEKNFEVDVDNLEFDKLSLYGSIYSTPREIFSDIVPPLDISSNTYTSTRYSTYSNTPDYKSAKINMGPNTAYEDWLLTKNKNKSEKVARQKRAEKQKQEEAEERKRLSEEKYQEWLRNKARERKKQQEKQLLGLGASKSSAAISSKPSAGKPLRAQLSESEVQSRVAEWEQRKRLELERQRKIKREEAEKQEKIAEERRKMSLQAWEKWNIDAHKKPKPVPLNRGFDSLRGTISDIFVNPNEWQNIIPEKDD